MSNRHISIIALSLTIPNALNTIKSGTGFLTLGISTTIFLFVKLLSGATIFIDNVLFGFDTFSETLLISAEYKYSNSLIPSSSISLSSSSFLFVSAWLLSLLLYY